MSGDGKNSLEVALAAATLQGAFVGQAYFYWKSFRQ
jgi:hypothetical protein